MFHFKESEGIAKFYVQVFPKGLNETLTIWRLYNDWSQGKLKAWQKGQVSLKAGDKVCVM